MASLAFPEELFGGLRVGKLGKSSVKYEIGIFKKDSETAAAVSLISLAINSELHQKINFQHLVIHLSNQGWALCSCIC